MKPTIVTFPDGSQQKTAATASIPSGTVMLFFQATAPTGWTKSTSANDAALRVVSGSTGGTITSGSAFSSTFVNGNTGATTLSASQMPSHTHNIAWGSFSGSSGAYPQQPNSFPSINNYTASLDYTGGGGSHSHSLSLGVAYVDVIICTKN